MNAQPTQAQIDADLEQRIEDARQSAMAAAALDPDLAREYFAERAELIAQRSPRRVAEMEARLPGPWGAKAP